MIKALKREELAQLEGIQRHLALSKSLLPNIIRICRRNRRADTRLAVLTLITLLCDNNEGVCRLSVIRMAELLSRKEDNVRKAINNLEAHGELFVNRVNGLPNSYWPRVPVEVSTMNPAMTWFVDALSTKPAPRGRPATQPSMKCSPASGGPFENQSKNLPREASKSPPAKADSISLNDIALKKEGALARSAPPDDPRLNDESTESAARARRMRDAVAIYNRAAEQGGFCRCQSLTEARRRRLTKRLDDIGGIENFRRALSAILKDDWLMGRKKPKPGESRFKLDIDYLMRTDDKSGDVLAKLVDKAAENELAECERFNVAWLHAFGNHMLGDPWDPPQWVADFAAPRAAIGQPFTVEQARAWVRETPLWVQILDRYASGTGREDEFGCIRQEMFEKAEREQLIANRLEALKRTKASLTNATVGAF